MRSCVRMALGMACLVLVFMFIQGKEAWLQEPPGGGGGAKLEQMLGQKGITHETTNFRIEAYESLGKPGIEAFGKKCEEAYTLGCKIFEHPVEKRLWGNNNAMGMIKTKADWERFVDAVVTDKGQARITKDCAGLGTGEPGHIACLEKCGSQPTLEKLLIHGVGHDILNLWDRQGKDLPVWIEEGFASYIESEICKDVGSSCIGGGTSANPAEHKWQDGGDWKGLLKDAVMNGKDKEPGCALTWDMIRRTRDYNSMTHSQRAKSWSLIGFLITQFGDTKKFISFIKKMKSAEKGNFGAQDKAIQEAYEMTFGDLETEWRKYVTKEY